jgi:hypothetical protein
MSSAITVDQLTPKHFERHPVWQFSLEDEGDSDETVVRPVSRLPVTHLDGRVVGLMVDFAGGQKVWTILGNVDCESATLNEHFLGSSFWLDDRWVPLARYHDPDRDAHGPSALAREFEVSVSDIFPISYDLRAVARGKAAALMGAITLEPRERLTREEVILRALDD